MTNSQSLSQDAVSSPAKTSLTSSISPKPQQSAERVQAGAQPQIIVNVPDNSPKPGTADILNGIAAILWPLVLAVIVLIFRKEIVSLTRRLKKGSAFGAEAEFEKDLEALNREASRAKEETSAITDGEQIADAEKSSDIDRDDAVSLVLSETARSPRLGLMLLSAEIEKLTTGMAVSTGNQKYRTLREQIGIFSEQLPPHTSAAFRLFSHVRNQIVHGREANEQEILSAIDSGLELYKALLAIPIEINIVADPGVEIFSDANGTQPAEGRGLILETTLGGVKSQRIFPTTKTHFAVGMRVTWEWDMAKVWGDTWYRDPITNDLKEAWSSSAEFVGRDFNEVSKRTAMRASYS